MRSQPLAVAVLASGRGSNLQALLDDAQRHPELVTIRAVISDQPQAFALERARAAGVPAEFLDPRGGTDRREYDRRLVQRLEELGIELVALAGFMRILGRDAVEAYAGRMLNIHPSLLPRHPGLDTHRRALQAGDREHGATVHFVTPDVDAGPAVLQYRLGIYPWDTSDSLATRVLRGEHRIYPRAVRWFAQERLSGDGTQALLDGQVLRGPVLLTEDGIADASETP